VDMDEDPLLFAYSPDRINDIFAMVSENAG
jgi:hypothetical protein